MSDALEAINNIKASMQKAVIGQDDVIDKIVIGLLCNGNLLLEGLPGTAKTRAVKTLANAIAADLGRIQFTPDLLPSDVTGTEVYHVDGDSEQLTFQPGPIFANLVLADEINRAPAKVQAALLEAMEERQVTVSGKSYKLPDLFMVLATQNPVEQEGTYPLPEAQVDRFMLKTIIDYPKLEDEQLIVRANLKGAFEKINAVVSVKQILSAQAAVREVYMDEKIEKYILDIVFATRYPEKYRLPELKPLISFGASPRGSINLATAAKCYAFIKRRGYVIPEDVRAVVYDVLRHRIGITYEAEAENVTSEDIISKIVNVIEVP